MENDLRQQLKQQQTAYELKLQEAALSYAKLQQEKREISMTLTKLQSDYEQLQQKYTDTTAESSLWRAKALSHSAENVQLHYIQV